MNGLLCMVSIFDYLLNKGGEEWMQNLNKVQHIEVRRGVRGEFHGSVRIKSKLDNSFSQLGDDFRIPRGTSMTCGMGEDGWSIGAADVRTT